MDETLLELIGNADTIADAFLDLEGRDLTLYSLSEIFKVVSARKNFAVIEQSGFGRFGDKNAQLLHPYGTNIAYYLNDRND